MPHALTFQSRDSACDSSIYTYSIALENKSKDRMITKTTCTNDTNNREDPTKAFKAHSKKHESFVYVVLCNQFISMD